jgi:DNA-binding NarL/FixJ family response regulator
MTPNPPVRIVVADDYPLIREGFQSLISRSDKLTMVGEARNGHDLVSLCHLVRPDIVITDVQMPEMDGIEASRKIREEAPDTGIIALSAFHEQSLVQDVLLAGARGYLLKDSGQEEICMAIHEVHMGGSYFCKEATPFLSPSTFTRQHHRDRGSVHPVFFSEKELAIIRFICQEYSSKQIAPHVQLTRRTVENYREKIQEKIGAKNLAGIVVYAVKHRLFPL